MRLVWDRELAYAAARDAGNKNAQRNGRTTWSRDDYIRACETYARIVHAPVIDATETTIS